MGKIMASVRGVLDVILTAALQGKVVVWTTAMC